MEIYGNTLCCVQRAQILVKKINKKILELVYASVVLVQPEGAGI